MSGHATLAPSSAFRWMRCPGSIAHLQRFPSQAGAAAAEGTFAHLVASKCLEENADAKKYLGSVSKGGAFKCDEGMVEAVQHYLDAVRSVQMMDGGKLMVEQKVRVAGAIAPHCGGTADAVLISADMRTLHVFDYKHGVGHFVDVEDNEQGMIYATGALVTFAALCRQVDEVFVHIVQPRCKQGKPWRTMKTTREALCKWADEELLPKGQRALGDNGATLVPSDEACLFCRKDECKAVQAEALELAQHVFADPADTDKQLVKASPDVAGLSAAQLGRFLEVAPRVKKFISDLEDRAKELALAGREVPGYKLVATLGDRKWEDAAAAAGMLRSMGVDPDTEPKTIGVVEAEKRLGKSKKLVAAFITRAEGKKLVPNSDRRKAINTADVFDNPETPES